MKRSAIRLAALAALIAALSSVAPLAAQDAVAPPPSDARAEIEEILLRLPDAWNARDAEAWVESFDERSGFTNILGMHFPDRAANRTRHAELFATIFADSRLEADLLSVRLVGADAALAELGFTLVGYDRLPPGVSETEPGVLRTRLVTVLERREGDWRIIGAQNTAILPAATGQRPGARP